jgi:hypothetical protein
MLAERREVCTQGELFVATAISLLPSVTSAATPTLIVIAVTDINHEPVGVGQADPVDGARRRR